MPAADPSTQKAPKLPSNSDSAPPASTTTTTTTTSPTTTATNTTSAPAAAPTGNAEDVSDIIDLATFEQIREMDDPGTDDFSLAIVNGFLEQAEDTFGKMERLLGHGNLEELSSLGHFLKGSSATLGLVKVKDYCEKIQHHGSKKDATGTCDIAEDAECLELIRVALRSMRDEYVKVERYFRRLYPDLEVSEA